MKGYYITYGIFSNEIENVIKDLEVELEINLTKGGYAKDYEMYYLDKNDKNNESKIKHFSISHGNPQGYHLNKDEILYPNYLISCNIILCKDEDEYILRVRNVLKSKKYIRELNFDVDEW
jgi:hypothetical protein